MSIQSLRTSEESAYMTIDTPDGSFRAYCARPRSAPSAAVVVVQEIFGVNADIRDTCSELATQGYLALSPDLFWRMEPGIDMSDSTEAEWKKGFALYSTFDYDKGVADIAATMNAARALLGAGGRVGLIGYCLGGLMTFLVSARRGADAAVAYYGGNTEKYLEESKNIKNPLMIHLGEEDEYISKDAQQAIIKAFQGHATAQIHTYPGRSHAFARHRGAHYDEAAAELANGRTATFFRQNLLLDPRQ